MTRVAPVPGWLARSAAVGWRVLAAAGVAVVVGLVAWTIPVSTTATLVSLVLAAALAPTALRLRARGLPPMAAAGLAFGVGALLIVGSVILLLVLLVPDLRAVGAATEQGLNAIRDRLADAGANDQLSRMVDQFAASLRASISPDTSVLVETAANVGTVLVLGTFLTFFLLADGDRGWAWLMRNFQPWQVAAVSASARSGLDRVAWYVRRTALMAAVDAVVVGVVLSIAGVPIAGALASIAFLAGFVPYLGAIAGGAVIALAALALGGTGAAIAVLVALLATWIISTRLLDRTAMGRIVDVSPAIVLVAIPAGLALFGILGLFALLPVTVFVIAISQSVIAALNMAPAGVLDIGAGEATDAASVQERGPRPNPVAVSELPDGVPVWLDRVGQLSWRALVLAGLAWLAIAVVVRIPTVVVPGVIAVVFAATLLPVVSRLVTRGWTRGVASGTATVGAMAFIVGSCLAAVAMTLGPLREVLNAAASGAGVLDVAWLREAVVQIGSGLEVDLAHAFFSLTAVALSVLLALLMTYFFMRDGGTWWKAAMVRLTPGRRAPVELAGERAVDVLAGYMIGTAAISAFGGVTSGLIMAILGLPLAIPIAVIGFFAGFIPYVGSFITTALALLVTLALGDRTDVIVMLVFTVVFNIAQGNFVTPLVYGKSLSLHPAVVLMAIPVGNEIAGVLGMFLVVPVAAMIAATWRLVLRAIDEAGLPPEASSGSASPEAQETTASAEAGPAPA